MRKTNHQPEATPTSVLALNDWTQQLVHALLLYLLLSLCLLLIFPWHNAYAHAGHGSASDDAYWAELAKDYPPFKLPGLSARRLAKQAPNKVGSWGEVIEWPHVAVSAANLPDGRILTFSSYGRQRFVGGNGKEFTYAATWDPETGEIVEINHPSHDMFAAFLVLLEDGRLIINGGNNRVPTTSFFDFRTNQWTKGASMNRGRWYPTSVALPDKTVFTALGTAGGQYPELWSEANGWKVLTGINLQKPILDYNNYYEREWWPLFHVDPRGKIFHSGPTPKMHVIDTAGVGNIREVGPEIHSWYPKHGTTVMYDEGKLLVAGGAIAGDNLKSANKAMIIDINGGTPVVTPIEPMKYARKFHNGVILPTGEVLVAGGNTSGLKFSDVGSILPAEIWNPATKKWRTVASISVPRNYHSVALLLPDGRVFSSGGGLCAPCVADHPNTQIYTPPYLYDENGNLARRPVISNAPDTIKHGQTLRLHSDMDISRFSMIKMSSTTHAVNTDLRYLKVPFTKESNGEYSLTMHANKNILTPGYWMLFAINSKGVPSKAKILQIKTQGSPNIIQPNEQASLVGSQVLMNIQATDPDNEPLHYSANNLPQGLSINQDTGEISGIPETVENRIVSITVVNSTVKNTVRFEWKIFPRRRLPGVSYDLYVNPDPNTPWSDLPDFSQLNIDNYGVSDNFRWPDISIEPVNNLAIRFSAHIFIENRGEYTFYLNSSNGSKLWIDDSLLIESNQQLNSQEKQASIFLEKGEHTIIFAYARNASNSTPELTYRGPGFDRQTIASSQLLQNPLHNVAPHIINRIDQQNINIHSPLDLNIIANDANNDLLEFTAQDLPPGIQLDSSSGHIYGQATTIGEYTSRITVHDADNESDSIVINWVVSGELSVNHFADKPRPVDTERTFTLQTNGGVNNRFKWNFGDGSPTTAYSTEPSISHTFARPGRYTITATIETGQNGARKLINYQFIQSIFSRINTRLKPAVSMSVIYDQREPINRLWNVNPDNNTVTAYHPFMHAKLAEIPVGKQPRSLAKNPSDGTIWVVNKDSAKISIIDAMQMKVARTIPLPHASQPYGIVFSPVDPYAYVTLEGTSKLIQLDSGTGKITKTLDVGAYPRHLSISADGETIYISRYITPPLPGENTGNPKTEINGKPYGGELIVVDVNSFSIKNTIILKHSERPDSAREARGIPNYLGTVALSPDGTTAWIPSKQDNIKRGAFRDGKPLTHDTAIRSVTSKIDLVNEKELSESRIDHDNAGIASAAIYGKFGNLVFVALEGSREVEVIDAYSNEPLFRFDSGGHAPQGLALSPDGQTLFVHNFMERAITVFDLHDLIYGLGNSVQLKATYPLVENERLSPQILHGKQLFYDSRDERLSREKYSSCAQCHNEGNTDGRVWDMGNFGEGLRNTISLIGHEGAKQGPLHWSANFNEVQDFEIQIRNLSGGKGLIANNLFHASHDPSQDIKAGLSQDFDDLASYLESLGKIPDSPFKTSNGKLTERAKKGETLFIQKGCQKCHSGKHFTDKAGKRLHNIGTIKPTSGKRLNGALTGINTPTLRGLWKTAPYLHDGSARTLQDAIKQMPAATTAEERDLLAEYLMQIDGNTPQPGGKSNDGDGGDTTSQGSSGGGGSASILGLLILFWLGLWRFFHYPGFCSTFRAKRRTTS